MSGDLREAGTMNALVEAVEAVEREWDNILESRHSGEDVCPVAATQVFKKVNRLRETLVDLLERSGELAEDIAVKAFAFTEAQLATLLPDNHRLHPRP